ncbi:transcriptional regulator ExsA [Pedobacter sp. BAL39]|uniref:helix-turn-helix domain-containing protein n=1 Tax=Pedobacter sp. BAL39 TaxID=391596 RepID=UPI0001559580|nr:AraC family transcriptional regulator [Pedobacter sp. BAL39]EDM34804.1 transcriptional regulator ExsA [Pedobacter sp. BAL39]
MGTCSLFEYVQENQIPRSKILLSYNLISFLEQGEKVVYYAGDKTSIGNDSCAILCSGKYLMTEKLPLNGSYQSTMLLFDNSLFNQFSTKYAAVIDEIPRSGVKPNAPFAVFQKDPFITAFITSLKLIKVRQTAFAEKMLELKFEELMLHLLEKYPNKILALKYNNQETPADLEIRKAVEQNITDNLSLTELSFLCNQSLSTFKRNFVKLYGENPSSYFLKRRMEMAKTLLIHEHPSEVYLKLGYENHSSFSKSFKQIHGVSPSQFKSEI